MTTRPITPELSAEIIAALRAGEACRAIALRLNASRSRIDRMSTEMRKVDMLRQVVAPEREMLGTEPLPAGCSITMGALPVLACLQGVGL